jgi:hypothetical protein
MYVIEMLHLQVGDDFYVLWFLNPLKPSGNCINHLLYQSVNVNFVLMSLV